MQTETVFLDFREFPFFLFAFIAGIMLVDSHFAAFSLYPQRLFYSADIGGSDAFVRIQDISPCSHIVKQSAARKSDEIAPHPSALIFFLPQVFPTYRNGIWNSLRNPHPLRPPCSRREGKVCGGRSSSPPPCLRGSYSSSFFCGSARCSRLRRMCASGCPRKHPDRAFPPSARTLVNAKTPRSSRGFLCRNAHPMRYMLCSRMVLTSAAVSTL